MKKIVTVALTIGGMHVLACIYGVQTTIILATFWLLILTRDRSC